MKQVLPALICAILVGCRRRIALSITIMIF